MNARQIITSSYTWTITDNGLATTPSTPLKLQIKVSTGQAFLNWTAPANTGGPKINGYNIYESTTSGSDYILICSSTYLNFTAKGLTNGVTYYFIVNAVNDVGAGANSTEVNGTPLGVPTFPMNLQVIQHDQQFNLTWTAPISDGGLAITNYTIYRSVVSGSGYVSIGNSTTLTFIDTNVTAGITYYYVVRANNAYGQSAMSSQVSGLITKATTTASSSTTTPTTSDSTISKTGKSSPFSLVGMLAGLGILFTIKKRRNK